MPREMTTPEGPFYSTLDADSEGDEGKFYVWTLEEIDAVLGDDAPLFSSVYGVRAGGNWTTRTTRRRRRTSSTANTPFAELAAWAQTDEAELTAKLAACRAKLFAVRAKRVRPGLDDKMLTAWNGLMITAFATAAAVLDEPRVRERRRRRRPTSS